MSRIGLSSVGVAVLCFPGLVAEAGTAVAPPVAPGWPRFLGPAGDGFSPETGINKSWRSKPPANLWTVPLSDGGYSGPSAAAGRVFIIDHQGSDDIVRALDVATGKEAWRFAYPDAQKDDNGFARSTPTFDAGRAQDARVFTFSREGKIHCLNALTGAKVWAADAVRDLGGQAGQWGYAGSPVVDGDRLVVSPGGSAAVALLDKRTGKLLGKGGGGGKAGYATPVVATILGRKQYVAFTASGPVGVDAGTLQSLWSYDWKTKPDVNAATPLVVGNSVFITSGYKHGCAMFDVTASGARARWENKEIQSHFSTPVHHGGYVYGTTDPGRIVCLDAKDGSVKWEQKGFGKGGLCAVDGTLIVLDGASGEAAMIELSPSGYRELGRAKPLGGQSWTAPVVAEGKLIVRNKNSLACLDLR